VLDHVVRVPADDEAFGVRLADEAFAYGVVQIGQEGAVVVVVVQQDARLAVQAELGPGEGLEELLDGAEAAGECYERLTQFGHEGLAAVHVGNDAELGQTFVCDLVRDHALGENADDGAARAQGGVRDGAHQADGRAAVDQTQPGLGDGPAQRAGGAEVRGGAARRGAAEDGDALHQHRSCSLTSASISPRTAFRRVTRNTQKHF
jgi:hypothetical protein